MAYASTAHIDMSGRTVPRPLSCPPRFATCEDDEDEYDPDDPRPWACSWCGGRGEQENDDPLRYDGDTIPCVACNGTGQRHHQWLF